MDLVITTPNLVQFFQQHDGVGWGVPDPLNQKIQIPSIYTLDVYNYSQELYY